MSGTAPTPSSSSSSINPQWTEEEIAERKELQKQLKQLEEILVEEHSKLEDQKALVGKLESEAKDSVQNVT